MEIGYESFLNAKMVIFMRILRSGSLIKMYRWSNEASYQLRTDMFLGGTK